MKWCIWSTNIIHYIWFIFSLIKDNTPPITWFLNLTSSYERNLHAKVVELPTCPMYTIYITASPDNLFSKFSLHQRRIESEIMTHTRSYSLLMNSLAIYQIFEHTKSLHAIIDGIMLNVFYQSSTIPAPTSNFATVNCWSNRVKTVLVMRSTRYFSILWGNIEISLIISERQ